MANEEHLEILKHGVERWNRWREENPDILPNLSGLAAGPINLTGANLWKVNFFVANLTKINLIHISILPSSPAQPEPDWFDQPVMVRSHTGIWSKELK